MKQPGICGEDSNLKKGAVGSSDESIQNVYSEKQRGHKTHQMFGEGF